VVGKRVRPKERVGFGEPVIVRDQPGILVVEESHFPAWLWWSLWIVTAYMKDGSSQVLAELPYCEKVVSALKKHLPGLLAADGQSDVVPP